MEVTRNGLPELWLDYTLSLGPTREDKGQTDSWKSPVMSLQRPLSLWGKMSPCLGAGGGVQGDRASH